MLTESRTGLTGGTGIMLIVNAKAQISPNGEIHLGLIDLPIFFPQEEKIHGSTDKMGARSPLGSTVRPTSCSAYQQLPKKAVCHRRQLSLSTNTITV